MEKELNMIEKMFGTQTYTTVEEKYKEVVQREPDSNHPIWKLLVDLPGYGPCEDSGLKSRYEREYIGWGPYADYLWNEKSGGWNQTRKMTFEEFKKWKIDDFNIPIDFYFTVHQDSLRCPHCEEQGLNEETLKISKSWYNFEGLRNWVYTDSEHRYDANAWSNNIEQQEVEALIRGNRLNDLCKKTTFIHNESIESKRYWFDEDKEKWLGWPLSGKSEEFDKPMEVKTPDFPTAEEVNEWNRGRGMGHDSINQWICVKSKAKRLGVYGDCPNCEGRGHVFY